MEFWRSNSRFCSPKNVAGGKVYTVDSLLTDTSIRRTLLYNGHLELVPALAYSLYLTLYKMDISLRQTLSAGPKGVRLGESWLYPFLNKNSRTFKDTFLILQGLHSAQKRALGLCLFYFFQNMSNIIILKVFRSLLGSE